MSVDFRFVGQVPASKSLLNRALVVQSFFPSLKVYGSSVAEDVRLMRQGLNNLFLRQAIDCGHGGTVLRFLALRASREKGSFVLRGSQRLMSRRQEDLLRLLRQLGVAVECKDEEIHLHSEGWHPQGDGLQVPSSHSSQFASALLINSWNLKRPLHFVLEKNVASSGYWQMTIDFLRTLGLALESHGREYSIPAEQVVLHHECVVDPDMSSAFALAAAAVMAGEVVINPFPERSLQPDFEFVDILKEMGVQLKLSEGHLHIHPSNFLRGIRVNLNNTPDLFPVLSVLCALAEGESHLYGAPQLKDKESNRLVMTERLLSLMGARFEVFEDGMKIWGPVKVHREKRDYDPNSDHRMAMAAAVANKAGFRFNVLNKSVVDKSYPEFWQAIGEKK